MKKQWLYTGETPLWLHVAEHFGESASFDQVIIVSTQDEISLMKNFASYTYIEGGNSRQASLINALQKVTSEGNFRRHSKKGDFKGNLQM